VIQTPKLEDRIMRYELAGYEWTAIKQMLPNKPRGEWLLIEWPKGEDEPTKYFLSTLPADIAFHRLVYFAKLRWRIERDYHELKQEVGLGHFEGRRWRVFHHHATLCIAAYGFLISERETIPPQERGPPRSSRNLAFPQGTDPEELPLRPERHIPNSIATMRIRLANAIARTLPRCPCCGQSKMRPYRNL
jgi:DDE family transposase